MAIKKEDVRKALDALESASPELAKGGDLNEPEGAAQGGGDGSLKAPGTPMSGDAPKGKGKEVKKGEFPPPAKDVSAFDKDEDEDDDGDDDDGDDKKDPPFKKSKAFTDDMPGEIQTKVDVSTFLKSLVDHTAVTVNGLRDALMKSDIAQDARITTIEDGLAGLAKSLGNIGVVLGAICERIGVIENQPAAAPKSVVKSVTAAPVERTFADPAAGATTEPAGGQGLYKSLEGKPRHVQKSMISESLCDLVRKGEATDIDVINFESNGYIPAAIDAKLRAVL